MTEIVQIHTTTDSEDEAERLAAHLIDHRLVACVQVHGPIRSHYRWQGKLEHSVEWLCVAKTTQQRSAAVIESLQDAHSYDQPEILATPVIEGSRGYLDWVRKAVSDEKDSES